MRHGEELRAAVRQAREEERKRVARELHDEMGQALSAMLMGIDQLTAQVPEALQPGFSHLRASAERALREAHRIAHRLRPEILDTVGLATALQMLGEEFRGCGLQVEIQIDPEVGQGLAPEVEAGLFRVAQEALANACQHAQATRVNVALSLAAEGVLLSIEDNGGGFDSEQIRTAEPHRHLGLRGMHERAALLGGCLSVQSAPGTGTHLTLTVPRASRASRTDGAGRRAVSGPAPLRVLLVEDHAMVREGIRALLEAQPDIVILGEANDGQQALVMVEQLGPEVVVLDITMPRLGGLEAAAQIRARFPTVRVVLLTVHENCHYLAQAARLGVTGYVVKRSAGRELMTALERVGRGETYISPAVAGVVLEGYRSQLEGAGALTKREQEVLRLVAEGRTNQEIAEELIISVKTVEAHRAHLMRKLDAHDRTDLVKYAIRSGMISAE